MRHPDKAELLLIGRFVDGELGGVEHAAFARRVAADADLRAAIDDLRKHRRLVRSADDAVGPMAGVPVGFAARVLDSVRRMPSREELVRLSDEGDWIAEVVGFARRLVVAAAVILGVALLLGLLALGAPDTENLSASATEELRQIDQRVLKLKLGGESETAPQPGTRRPR
jgi:anti-sigma factor RsiW